LTQPENNLFYQMDATQELQLSKSQCFLPCGLTLLNMTQLTPTQHAQLAVQTRHALLLFSLEVSPKMQIFCSHQHGMDFSHQLMLSHDQMFKFSSSEHA
jgi:hypothetical protein